MVRPLDAWERRFITSPYDEGHARLMTVVGWVQAAAAVAAQAFMLWAFVTEGPLFGVLLFLPMVFVGFASLAFQRARSTRMVLAGRALLKASGARWADDGMGGFALEGDSDA